MPESRILQWDLQICRIWACARRAFPLFFVTIEDNMPGFDSMQGQIWIDGELRDWTDARVHLLTHGLHYASSVFEGNRAYGGQIFKLTEHSERLHRSAEFLGFEIPYSVEQINAACIAVLEANGLAESDAYVRPIAWRGSEMMAISAQNTTIHLAVATWQMGKYFKKDGVRLQTTKWRRPSPESAPVHSKAAGLYMICTLAKHAAEKEGFDDALMLDYRGYIAEGTGANVFFVHDGALHTPTPDCFLDGITRRTVIELARAQGMQVVERHISPDELPTFSEAFFTGTAAEVTPISQIDGQHFNVGAVTDSLVQAYTKATRGE